MKKIMIRHVILSFALIALINRIVHARTNARLGHFMTKDYAQGEAMNKFAELASQYTDNNINIQVYHSGVLGSDDKMLQAVQTGTQEFYVGVIGLAWTGLGFRNLSNNRHPIMQASDIKGLKIRVMATPISIETWKALGANPTPLAISEVFTALEINAIDGQENPLQNIYANKFHEVQKYITLTNHVYTPSVLVASKKFWDKLAETDKAGIRKAATEAGIYQRELLEKGEKAVIAQFEAASVRIDSLLMQELEKIQEAVKPVVEKFSAQMDTDFVKAFHLEIEQARAANATLK